LTDFGDTIKESRLGQNIGLRELARRVEMSPQYLSNIENGRVPAPSAEIVERLALELGENKEELLLLARRIDTEIVRHAKKVAPKLENINKVINFFDSALKLGEDNPLGGIEGVIELAIGESLFRGGKVLKGAALAKFMVGVLKDISEQEDGTIPEDIQQKRAMGRLVLSMIQEVAASDSNFDELIASSQKDLSEMLKRISENEESDIGKGDNTITEDDSNE